MFIDYFVKDQELMLHDDHITAILKSVPEEIQQKALDNWNNKSGKQISSLERWSSLEKTIIEYSSNV